MYMIILRLTVEVNAGKAKAPDHLEALAGVSEAGACCRNPEQRGALLNHHHYIACVSFYVSSP